VAPSDGSAAPSKVADMQVTCLRWHRSGLYACAVEPTNPYSLGFAAEATQGFVPLWQRANTCRDACTPEAPLEMKCRDPWEAIAPLVGAGTAVCDASSLMPDAGTDAGSVGTGFDPAVDVSVLDTAPTKATSTAAVPAASANGCAIVSLHSVGTPWWLAAMLLLWRWSRRWLQHANRPPPTGLSGAPTTRSAVATAVR